jgi:ATP-binding cassette, subfamily C, bacterial exporter for protease/lipase
LAAERTDEDPIREAIMGERPLFVAALAFSAVISVFALTTSLYMLEVFDRVLTSRSVATLILLTLMATGAILVHGFMESLRQRLLIRAGLRVGQSLSPRVLTAMVATSAQIGQPSFRTALRDVDTLRNFIGSQTCGALFDIPYLLFYLLVLWFLHPYYLLVVLFGGLVLAVIAWLGHIVTSPAETDAAKSGMRSQEFAEDSVGNADVLEGMGMTTTVVGRWRKLWLDAMRSGARAAESQARFAAASKAVRYLIQIALMCVGALLVLDFNATGGIMIGATIIGSRAVSPIEILIGSWRALVNLRLVHGRLNALLNGAPAREESMPLPAPQGHVRVTGVSYVMASTRRTVLSNVNFALSPGESLAVIGPSASGKSTLARLLVGAWPCSNGAVRIDGANIYAWPRAALGRYIGYLPQDVELFSGTVRENIARLGEDDPEAVVRAAQLAHAHDMILALPHGYDTQIGSAGHWLSGGQCQRIALARALYGDPRLVVLDEPNSNLDGVGEQALVDALRVLKGNNVTVIIIAHRPSVVSGTDKMLVLGPGGVQADYGPTEEILAKFGVQSEAPRAASPLKGPEPKSEDETEGQSEPEEEAR